MSTHTLTLTLDCTDDQWGVLSAEASRSCFDPSPSRLAAAVMRGLAATLDSERAADREGGFNALRLLGVLREAKADAPPGGFPVTLARLRESATLTLADLGDAAGLSRQRVHQLEAGTHRPGWHEVQALADALDVSTEVFRDPV